MSDNGYTLDLYSAGNGVVSVTLSDHTGQLASVEGDTGTPKGRQRVVQELVERLRRCERLTDPPSEARVEELLRARLGRTPSERPTPAVDATAADLVRAGTTVEWTWPLWIQKGVLNILGSDPGVGKTRFCGDLARRVYHGLPWPDDSPPTLPQGTKTLWVAADHQHAELASLPQAFGFPPEALVLNTAVGEPYGGTMLDSEEDLGDFEERIARVKPGLVFVDTCLNATDRSSHKPEDAKAFFVPLAQIAVRSPGRVPIICCTHLNAAGKPLGRRIMGQGRVVFQMEHPDPEGQPNRRKLVVVKSNSLYPAALGVTMGNSGNDYDKNPPTAPAGDGPGQPTAGTKVLQAALWVQSFLSKGPKAVGYTRKQAEEAGFAAKTLYRARDLLKVEEFEAENKKWWQLTSNNGYAE